MQKKIRKLCVVVALALAMLLVGQAALADYSAKVLTSAMNVYLTPDTSATPAAQLLQGTSFNVSAINGEWAYINYRGHKGFARMQNIMFDNSISAYAVRSTELLFVTHSSYQQRVSYRGTIAAGTHVYVRGISSGYLLVTNASGSILGFVHQSDFVRG